MAVTPSALLTRKQWPRRGTAAVYCRDLLRDLCGGLSWMSPGRGGRFPVSVVFYRPGEAFRDQVGGNPVSPVTRSCRAAWRRVIADLNEGTDGTSATRKAIDQESGYGPPQKLVPP